MMWSQAQNGYDAIVVGSGISGGWAAKELTGKGLRVLLLEWGENGEHVRDSINATEGPWGEAPTAHLVSRWTRPTTSV